MVLRFAIFGQPKGSHCCEPLNERINFLSTPTEHTHGCRFVNITVDEDFTTSDGVQLAIDGLRGPRDALWFAPPCTGESSWQRLNIVRHPHLLPKLEADRELFKRLFKSFRRVAVHALTVGAQVYMELPRYCEYWKYLTVQSEAEQNIRHRQESGFSACRPGLFLYLKTKEAKTKNMDIRQHRISPSSSLYSKGGNTLQKVGTVAVHII